MKIYCFDQKQSGFLYNRGSILSLKRLWITLGSKKGIIIILSAEKLCKMESVALQAP